MAELDHIGVRFVRGNLINIGKVKEHIERQDIVFHLAAIRGERKISWAEYYKVNVEATQRLLEISANTGVLTICLCTTQHLDRKDRKKIMYEWR